jgi:hypothetical protein
MTTTKITTDGRLNIGHRATLGGEQPILLNNSLAKEPTTEPPEIVITNDKVEAVLTYRVPTTTHKGLQSDDTLQSETIADDHIRNTTNDYDMNSQTTNKSVSLKTVTAISKNVKLATKHVFNNDQQLSMLTISESKTMVPDNTVMLTEHLPYRPVTNENIVTNKLLLRLTNKVNQDLLTVANIETTVQDGATYTPDSNHVWSHEQTLHNFFNFNWRLATIQL